MMHPHLPSPRTFPVPDIGFALALSVASELRDAPACPDVPSLERLPSERIVWVPARRSWFGFSS
jgi:hypothetical protein